MKEIIKNPLCVYGGEMPLIDIRQIDFAAKQTQQHGAT